MPARASRSAPRRLFAMGSVSDHAQAKKAPKRFWRPCGANQAAVNCDEARGAVFGKAFFAAHGARPPLFLQNRAEGEPP